MNSFFEKLLALTETQRNAAMSAAARAEAQVAFLAEQLGAAQVRIVELEAAAQEDPTMTNGHASQAASLAP